ncbi:MAG: hypothetical protein ACLP7Q_27050 [Isosphaeraceae bacterium]
MNLGRRFRFNEALAVDLVRLVDEGMTREAAAARDRGTESP